jgi:tripartite-type tricarboxylate transporter receptor subunit TctC
VRGRVIDLASQHGLVASPGDSAHGVSKAAVAQRNRQIAVDFAQDGTRCEALAPGKILTCKTGRAIAPGLLAQSAARTPACRAAAAPPLAARRAMVHMTNSSRFGGHGMLRRGLLASLPALTLPFAARAQAAWPERNVRLIVPFAAGGGFDVTARAMAAQFARFGNGQTLVIDNRPGAGGTIAGALAARERPDGYTLMMSDLGPNVVGHEMMQGLPFDPRTAFTPIIHVMNLPMVLVAHPRVEPHDMAALLAFARANPERLTWSSPGSGNGSQFSMEWIQRLADIRWTHVAYRSGVEAVTAVIRGDVDLSLASVSSALPFIREGRVRAVAVSPAAGVAQLPDVGPIARALPGFDVSVWSGIVGPAGMEAALVSRINAVLNQVLQVPELRDGLGRSQAAEITGGTPERMAAELRASAERWTPIIREARIRIE